MQTTLDLLTKAREIMAGAGLAKETVYDRRTGGVCMQGALIGAAVGLTRANRSHIPAASLLPGVWRDTTRGAEALGFDGAHLLTLVSDRPGMSKVGQMCAWNNADERTLDECLDRFDEAIAALSAPAPALEPALEPALA